MKHLFIFNPQSLPKGKKREALLSKIKEHCKNLHYEIYFSSSAEDANEKARFECENNESICVYAGGGDGTIRQMAQAIHGFKNAILSVVPVGTGNDFIRNFGGKKAFLSLSHIADGETKDIDLLQANDLICANMINIGFDGSVVARVAKLRAYPLMGHAIAYTVGVIIQLLKFPKEHLRITYDNGETLDKEFLLTYIANGKYCGGGYCSASKAVQDDGKFDTMTVRPLSRLKFISLVGKYKDGTLLDCQKFKHLYRFSQNTAMSLHKDTPFDVCVDGEMFRLQDLQVKVLPKALRFKYPKPTSN